MSILSSPVDIDSYETQDDIINTCYIEFKECVLNKESRPQLFGREVCIPIGAWINNKAEIFWHISSLSSKDKISILPCNNDPAIDKCDKNCIYHKRQITLTNGEERDICFYRATKAFWVKELIELANQKDKCIKIWIKKDNKKKRQELYLRYQFRHIDYIVIFESKPSKYVLITAYPVFYINSKNGYDIDYQNYRNQATSEN